MRPLTRLQARQMAPVQLASRMSCFNPEGSHETDRWFPVWSIALGSFALVFSEVIPVGLLPNISHGLGVSVGLAGLMVVVPAVTAAVAAPVLTLRSSRVERRLLLRTLGALLLASNVVAATAPNFGVILIARALLGLCIAGFWVFGAGAAISLVQTESRSSAIAIVSGGIFAATVASLPISAMIGNLTTWRVGFLVAIGISGVAFLVQLAALPCLGTGLKVEARNLLNVVTRPAARAGLIAACAIFFADFAAYTYVNPLLQERAGLSGQKVTLVLLGFGLAGAATNFAAGRTVRHHLRATMFAAGALVCLGTLMIQLLNSEVLVIVFVLVWGAGFGVVPVAAQTWMAQTMPGAVEGGLALFTSGLQGSLAAGSALGGVLYNSYGTVGPLLTASIAAGLGSATVCARSAAVDRLEGVSRDATASSTGTRKRGLLESSGHGHIDG
jgi:predicted MFS family arabinose efflux permease